MSLIRHFFSSLKNLGESFQHFLLLAIRVYWGFGFFLSGYGKLINIQTTASFFSSLGFPFPVYNAYIAGSIECFGGLLLLFGLASRLAALCLAVVMIVAYLTAHLDSIRHIYEDPDTFFNQAPFLFLYAALIVFAFGAGRFSIDALFGRTQKLQGD